MPAKLQECLDWLSHGDTTSLKKNCKECRTKILDALEDARAKVKEVNAEHKKFEERFAATGTPDAGTSDLLQRVGAALKKQSELVDAARNVQAQCPGGVKKEKAEIAEEEPEKQRVLLPDTWMVDPNVKETSEACGGASLVIGRLDLKSGTVEGGVVPNNQEISVEADETGFIDGRKAEQASSFLEVVDVGESLRSAVSTSFSRKNAVWMVKKSAFDAMHSGTAPFSNARGWYGLSTADDAMHGERRSRQRGSSFLDLQTTEMRARGLSTVRPGVAKKPGFITAFAGDGEGDPGDASAAPPKPEQEPPPATDRTPQTNDAGATAAAGEESATPGGGAAKPDELAAGKRKPSGAKSTPEDTGADKEVDDVSTAESAGPGDAAEDDAADAVAPDAATTTDEAAGEQDAQEPGATPDEIQPTGTPDCFEDGKMPATKEDCQSFHAGLAAKKCDPATNHGLKVCGKCTEILIKEELDLEKDLAPDQQKELERQMGMKTGNYGADQDVQNADQMSQELKSLKQVKLFNGDFTRKCRAYAKTMPAKTVKIHHKRWRIPDMIAVEKLEPNHCLGAAVEGKINLKTGEVEAQVFSNTGRLDVEFDKADGSVKKGHFVPGKIIATKS
ncbi:unnamed protein product [Amoebophrya sp. A120]|nr:unnamed protein product [Amoebophrya sp. A120]|eukprot:GSA120T00017856001.1